MTATMCHDVPFSAIYWFSYETAKLHVHVPEEIVRDAFARTCLQFIACGAGAGLAAAVALAPLDVIKTVRQHRLDRGAALSYGEIFAAVRSSPSLAFAGLHLRFVRIPCGLAAFMPALETTKMAFAQRRLHNAGG
jgi:hypothetical protein